MAVLQILSGDVRLIGRKIPFPDNASAIIGRGQGSGLTLPDPKLSRRHCEISCRDGVMSLRDLGSTNGTFVNGSPIKGLLRLGVGDVIRIGDTEIKVLAEDEAAAGAAPASLLSPAKAMKITEFLDEELAELTAPLPEIETTVTVVAEVKWCELCGGSIPLASLAEGLAQQVGERYLCEDCLAEGKSLPEAAAAAEAALAEPATVLEVRAGPAATPSAAAPAPEKKSKLQRLKEELMREGLQGAPASLPAAEPESTPSPPPAAAEAPPETAPALVPSLLPPGAEIVEEEWVDFSTSDEAPVLTREELGEPAAGEPEVEEVAEASASGAREEVAAKATKKPEAKAAAPASHLPPLATATEPTPAFALEAEEEAEEELDEMEEEELVELDEESFPDEEEEKPSAGSGAAGY